MIPTIKPVPALLLFSLLLAAACNFSTALLPQVAANPTADIPVQAPSSHLPASPTSRPTVTLAPSSTPFPSRTPAPSLTPGPAALPKAAGQKVNAFHRSGQTFLTWQERKDLPGVSYKVYRSSQPITADNYTQATFLYRVPQGSARFYENRYNMGGKRGYTERYIKRFVIEDLGKELPSSTGLLVWTLSPADMGGQNSGDGYYAVTAKTSGGEEQYDPAYTLGPLSEKVDDPLPVEIKAGTRRGGHVYIQYMDLHFWNPTFHAPNDTNGYYGLNPDSFKSGDAIQYAYDYAVAEPDPAKCGGKVPAAAPLLLYLHGHKSNVNLPYIKGYSTDYCAYNIYPYDVTDTWWYGFAGGFDYRIAGKPQGDNVKMVNFTEYRVLRMVYDLLRQAPGPKVDPQRVYVYGTSMGGSGALAMAMRYPNVFVAAYASVPMSNFRTVGDGGGNDWRSEISYLWGEIGTNLPVENIAPGGWADALQQYNGIGVWDWQNHQEVLAARAADPMAPFGVAQGLKDTILEWATQGKPFYKQLNASRQAWGGLVANDGHTWFNFNGLPPTLRKDDQKVPFYGLKVIKNESVPGLGNSSNNMALPPKGAGGYNQTVFWSSSWAPWDGAPLDTPAEWRISLCSVSPEEGPPACGSGREQTVDVTPRRLQQFKIIPGQVYQWENHLAAGDAPVAAGQVTAGKDGLLTIPNFIVSPAGNRLLIKPLGQ